MHCFFQVQINKSSDGSSQVSKAEAPVESVALVVASWASGTTGASNMVATHAECGAPGASNVQQPWLVERPLGLLVSKSRTV